jgi:hypothetical protein
MKTCCFDFSREETQKKVSHKKTQKNTKDTEEG